MTLRHRIRAVLLHAHNIKIAAAPSGTTVNVTVGGPSGQVRSVPLGGVRPQTPIEEIVRNAVERQLQEAQQSHQAERQGVPVRGIPQQQTLPSMDPMLAQSVLQQLRQPNTPGTDILRLLSQDPDINAIARSSMLPALLMTNALTDHDAAGMQTRNTVADVFSNLQMPAMRPNAPR